MVGAKTVGDFKGHRIDVDIVRGASARTGDARDDLRTRLERQRQWIAVWLVKRYGMNEQTAKMLAAQHNLGSPVYLYAKEWAIIEHIWNDD